MHAVGTHGRRHVGSVVHHRERPCAARQLAQALRPGHQLAVVEPLVAQLNHAHAGLNQLAHQPLEFRRRFAATDQHTQPHPLKPLEA